MAKEMRRDMYHSIMKEVDKLDKDRLHDLASEIISELVNERHADNNERVIGIYEAMELVLNIEIIN